MNYPRRDGTGRGAGRGAMYPGKINAPTMAYMTVYGKEPFPPISGREASHATKDINGVSIDKHIPTSAIINLNKYPKLIELSIL